VKEVSGINKTIPEYTVVRLPEWQAMHERILSEFAVCTDKPERQSHFFHGRFENLYIGVECMPSLQDLLDTAAEQAAKILQLSLADLKYGYWFNLMYPGHVTSLHSHDEDDELLSCVYYLDVPQDSGNLILGLAEGPQSLVPEDGMFVFFPPQLEHEVTENRSASPRLSLAINFGPAG